MIRQRRLALIPTLGTGLKFTEPEACLRLEMGVDKG